MKVVEEPLPYSNEITNFGSTTQPASVNRVLVLSSFVGVVWARVIKIEFRLKQLT